MKGYTTEQLVEIVIKEQSACLKGDRLNLNMEVGSPFIDRFISTKGMQQFAAYQDFRRLIHDYQREHQVSGIVWHAMSFRTNDLHYPQVHDQLIAIDGDLEILHRAKSRVLDFWYQSTQDMELSLLIDHGKQHRLIHHEDVHAIVQGSDWATLFKPENSNYPSRSSSGLELILQLGWGLPKEWNHCHGSGFRNELLHAVEIHGNS